MPVEVKSSFDQERNGREGSLTRMAIINGSQETLGPSRLMNTKMKARKRV